MPKDTSTPTVRMLFLDIGGVLLTNGWDHTMRRKAAEKFGIDYDEMQERHHLTFDTYEEGKLDLEEYLNRVVFFEKRSFSHKEFREHMFAQSQPFQDMIALMLGLKEKYGLRVGAISNEGRELTIHRIKTFKLCRLIDFFVSSCFVHFRKPDHDIFRMALDIAQVEPEQGLYVDDRAMFVDIASSLGLPGIVHKGYESTRDALAQRGLKLDEQVVQQSA